LAVAAGGLTAVLELAEAGADLASLAAVLELELHAATVPAARTATAIVRAGG
jgi:hypothetical protein